MKQSVQLDIALPGHLDNLNEEQKRKLLLLWKAALAKMKDLPSKFYDDIWKGYLLFSEDPDICLLRILRGRSWNLERSIDTLYKTLEWRIANRVYSIYLENEKNLNRNILESGEMFCHGTDLEGRPVVYAIARNHFTGRHTLNDIVENMIYNIEVFRKLIPKGMETITVVYDAMGIKYTNLDLKSARYMISNFHRYYLEYLGRFYVVDAPRVISYIWKGIQTVLDPKTRSKVEFIQRDRLKDIIDRRILPFEFRGYNPYRYDYSTSLLDTTNSEDLYHGNGLKGQGMEKVFQDNIREFVEITLNMIEMGFNGDSNARNEIKQDLVKLCNEIEYLSVHPSYYHRLGMISKG
jgi:hypothetical protein